MGFLADAIQGRANLRRRLGKFTISTHVLEHNPYDSISALSGCVVVRAEALWHRSVIEYIAMHEDFDEIDDGAEATPYECLLYKHPDGTVTRMWERAS